MRGLQYLEDEGYILWPEKSTTEGIQVIKCEVLENTLPPLQNNALYWTW